VGEEALEDQRAEVDLLRRRVLNVVGHELRTPITTLRGLAELLGHSPDAAAEADLHEAIRRTARRTEALLDDLLVATGVSTALPVGEPGPVRLSAAATAAWDSLEGLDEHGELAIDGEAVLVARPTVARRLLSALLDNAARYGEPPVELRLAEDGDDVVVVVTDEGPGVPAAELPLVTEPFFRGERAVLHHHSLGLGLAVVKAMVDQAEGELQVRNRAGGGLEVEVRLPKVDLAG
jgi:signal transduction histidine kinase